MHHPPESQTVRTGKSSRDQPLTRQRKRARGACRWQLNAPVPSRNFLMVSAPTSPEWNELACLGNSAFLSSGKMAIISLNVTLHLLSSPLQELLPDAIWGYFVLCFLILAHISHLFLCPVFQKIPPVLHSSLLLNLAIENFVVPI